MMGIKLQRETDPWKIKLKAFLVSLEMQEIDDLLERGKTIDYILLAFECKKTWKRYRAALEDIAKQHKSNEWEQEGDTIDGYDTIIEIARAALKGDE